LKKRFADFGVAIFNALSQNIDTAKVSDAPLMGMDGELFHAETDEALAIAAWLVGIVHCVYHDVHHLTNDGRGLDVGVVVDDAVNIDEVGSDVQLFWKVGRQ